VVPERFIAAAARILSIKILQSTFDRLTPASLGRGKTSRGLSGERLSRFDTAPEMNRGTGSGERACESLIP